MIIKSIQFLSGSLRQELQNFKSTQTFSQSYANLSKEFRSERIGLQNEDPSRTLQNGFVERLEGTDSENNMKQADFVPTRQHTSRPEMAEQNVYQRLIAGNVSVLEPTVSFGEENSHTSHPDHAVDAQVQKSMTAMMHVLGEDNYSQKLRNDNSNWAQNQYERVERIEDELQERQLSNSDRGFSREQNNSQDMRDIQEPSKRNYISQRQEGNGKNRLASNSIGTDQYAQRKQIQRQEIQKNISSKRQVDESNDLKRERRDNSILLNRKSERRDVLEKQASLQDINGIEFEDNDLDLMKEGGVSQNSFSHQETSSGLSNEASTYIVEQKKQDIDKNLHVLHEVLDSDGSEIHTDLFQVELDVSLEKNTSQLVDINQGLVGFMGELDDSVLSSSDTSSPFGSNVMALSDIVEVLGEHNSILQEDTLISVVTEFQDELLELDEILYGSMTMNGESANTNVSLLMQVPNGTTAKSLMFQQIQNIAKPLGKVMLGLQGVQKNPNMTMMDDFILDMKWERSISKNSGLSSLYQQTNIKNSLEAQLHSEIQNTFEQGLKGSMQAKQSPAFLDSGVQTNNLLSENQSISQIANGLGAGFDGSQSGASQQDISHLLQNIDMKQMKELQHSVTRDMFSKMVKVIERLMEQYKPPFDPNVLKQLEIRVQDPSGVIVLDISQDKSQILVKAIVPDVIHQEFSQSRSDIERSLSDHGLELGSWEMTKQSESEEENSSFGRSSLPDTTDASGKQSNSETIEQSEDISSDRLIEKNI